MDNPTSSTPAPGPAPAPQAGFFAAIRRTGLYRSDERWIGGVCGGLAARFGVDPLLVRGIVAVTVLLGGFGLVLYAIGWAFLPEQRDGRIHLEGLTLGHPDIALLGALLMLIVGLGRGSFGFGANLPGWLQGLFWVAAVVGVVALVATAASNRSTAPRPPSSYGPFPTGAPVPPPGVPVPPAAPGTFPASAASAGYRASAPATGPAPYGPPTYGPGPAAGQPAPHGTGYPPPPQSPYGPYGPYPTSYGAPAGRSPDHPQPPYGPGPSAPRPVATATPVYPSPVRRTAGLPWVGSVVAIGLLTLAGLLIAHRMNAFTGPIVATAAGVTVVLAGLAIIAAGLRGRRSGGLTAVAIIALLIAGPASLGERTDWTSPDLSNARQVNGSQTVVLTDRDAAARGVRAGVGDTRIDLTAVPMEQGTLEVPLWLAVGNYTVVVPRGTAVTATVDLGAGSVQWRLDGGNDQANGVGISHRTFSNSAAQGGTSQLHLRISMGTGDLTIEEQ